MAKPTGTTGPFESRVNSDGQITGSFQQISFPSSKEVVEEYISSRFIYSMKKHLATCGENFILWDAKRNQEDDFDFTVSTSKGSAFLELLEAAPLSGRYQDAPSTYRPYDLARHVFSEVVKKSDRYPKSGVRDIFLLIYVTHWTFALSDSTVACLRYWLARTQTAFGAVFFYIPLDAEEGYPGWLFPIPPEFIAGFDPELIRDQVCLNLNPQKFEVVHERKP